MCRPAAASRAAQHSTAYTPPLPRCGAAVDPETKSDLHLLEDMAHIASQGLPQGAVQQMVQMHLVHGTHAVLQHHNLGGARAQHTGPSEPGTAQHKVLRRAGIAPA